MRNPGIKEFARGINEKPDATRAFENIVSQDPRLKGEVVYGYPIRRGRDRLRTVDAFLVSDTGHITVIDLVEGPDPGDYENRQDDAFNLIDTRLRQNPAFRVGRRLAVPLQTLTYGPRLVKPVHDDQYPIAVDSTLADLLAHYRQSTDPHTERTQEAIVLQIFNSF